MYVLIIYTMGTYIHETPTRELGVVDFRGEAPADPVLFGPSEADIEIALAWEALGGKRLDSYPEYWVALSPEQRDLARAVGAAILSGPLTTHEIAGDLPVQPEGLRLVRSDVYRESGNGKLEIVLPHNKGRTRPEFYLVYDGPIVGFDDQIESIRDLGLNRSWERIMAAEYDEIFQVDVDGVRFDMRRGVTRKSYAAMAYDCIARGVRPPDSGHNEHGGYWTRTWLTGEDEIVPDRAPTATMYYPKRLTLTSERTNCNEWGLRFRPMVKLFPKEETINR